MKSRILYSVLTVVILLSLLLFVCDRLVERASEGKLYNDVSRIPKNEVGLLLGTGKYLESGGTNPYYQYRIDAALELFKAGKIDYLLISGDNSRKDYNEPEMMRRDLVDLGIDSTLIYLDYAGFRTFDSMLRLKKVFKRTSVTVISQRFHNQRALYIASKEKIDAVAYSARDVSIRAGRKIQFREKLARVNAVVDYLIGTRPKFLGEEVRIP